MADTEGFLGRWSRLKRQADAPIVNPPPPGEQTPGAPVATPEESVSSLPATLDGKSQADRPEESPPPTLEDVAQLTPTSDFADFVAAKTPTLVKNAALKKLFSDPHFNIMDGLDIYIDDYSLPDPMPDDWLDKLEHAKGWLTPSDAEREAARAVTADLQQPALISSAPAADAPIANGPTQNRDILSADAQNQGETFCPEQETLGPASQEPPAS